MNHDLCLHELEQALGHSFSNPGLMELALTHSSFANEQGRPHENNERLEFLGDAVLELCISAELYTRFPDVQEGQLTSFRAMLVSATSLARRARSIDLGRFVLLGKGEESQGGRDRSSVLSDCFEALIGAVFLDGGYARAMHCILGLFEPHLPDSPAPHHPRDYKSRLQELTQQLHQDRPRYVLAQSSGPEHEKLYHVEVHLPEGTVLSAHSSSIKKAEQKAARQAYLLLTSQTLQPGS